jgi:hypothetical protein
MAKLKVACHTQGSFCQCACSLVCSAGCSWGSSGPPTSIDLPHHMVFGDPNCKIVVFVQVIMKDGNTYKMHRPSEHVHR